MLAIILRYRSKKSRTSQRLAQCTFSKYFSTWKKCMYPIIQANIPHLISFMKKKYTSCHQKMTILMFTKTTSIPTILDFLVGQMPISLNKQYYKISIYRDLENESSLVLLCTKMMKNLIMGYFSVGKMTLGTSMICGFLRNLKKNGYKQN